MRETTCPLTLPSPPVGERDQNSPSRTEDQRSWPIPLTLPPVGERDQNSPSQTEDQRSWPIPLTLPPVGERDQNSPSQTEDQRLWPMMNPSPSSRGRGPQFEPRRCRRVGGVAVRAEGRSPEARAESFSGEARAESGEGGVFRIGSWPGGRGSLR